MISAIADTHAIIWYLFNDSRLSSNARQAMEDIASQSGQIGVSAISLVELVYLIEKGRIPVESLTRLAREIEKPVRLLVEIPLDLRVARALTQVDVSHIPDMPDRIVAATALSLEVPVISRDSRIQASNIQTIW